MIKLYKDMYVSDEKLIEFANMHPTSYLSCLEAASEIIRHAKERTETEDALVIENALGKVGFKRNKAVGIWLLKYAVFKPLSNI